MKTSIEKFLNFFKSNPLNLLILVFIVIILSSGAFVANQQLKKEQKAQSDKTATKSATESSKTATKSATKSNLTPNPNGYYEESYDGPAVILYVDGMQLRPNRGGQVSIDSGQTTKTVTLRMTAKSLNIGDCSLVRDVTLDDTNFTKQTIQMEAKEVQQVQLVDGEHFFKASCNKGSKVYVDDYTILAADKQPKLCKGFQFVDSSITVTTLEELKSSIVGTWEGCVTTPWTPAYFVSMTFSADGGYSAVSNEKLDSVEMNALYNGIEANHPLKKYYLNSLQADNSAIGEIDIVFDTTVAKGDLKSIKLMGNKLSFEFFHLKKYGPLKFQLNKK